MMNHFSRHLTKLLILATTVGCALGASSSTLAANERVTTAPNFRLAALPGLTFIEPLWVGGASARIRTLYVAEKRGVVWKLVGTRKILYLDLRSVVQSAGREQGLLSVAFAHDYVTSGHVYVYFTRKYDGVGVVRSYTARRGIIVPRSARTIIKVPFNPPADVDENGGTLISDDEHNLWLSTGDGGSQGAIDSPAQKLGSLAGKILRVSPKARGGYTIPKDNPFVGRAGARGEVWALGLRQPWRFSVDAPTGDIWIGEVGQESREEVDRLRRGRPAGANFGWPRMEGNLALNPTLALTPGTAYVRPFVSWNHASAEECHAVMGGGVYRGPVKQLQGWYLYGSLCGNQITALNPATRATVTRRAVPGIDTFGTGVNGHMYIASIVTGKIYRIVGA